MCLRFVTALLACALLLTGRANAQTAAPDATHELQLIESTERELDPLGLDDSTGRSLDEAARQLILARERAARAPKPRNVLRGEVLSGLDGVRELSHELHVRLAEGLAFVHHVMRFGARAPDAAELAYRLPLPHGAKPYALRVCKQGLCRSAVPGPTSASKPSEPVTLHASPIRDARGSALSLQASSVDERSPLELHVQYVAPAELHGGVVRFELPARGHDERIVPARLHVETARGLTLDAPAGEELLPFEGLTLTARMAARQPLVTTSRARCAGAPCARTVQLTPPALARPRETWLLLDASPSMEGPARNRADLVLSALLGGAPAESPLRVFAFAARAREVGQFSAQGAPLKLLSDALLTDLGAASHPASVLALEPRAVRPERPLLLLLSDGKLDAAAQHELSQLRARGELWLLHVGDPKPRLRRACDGVLELGPERSALDHDQPERIEERLRVLYAARPGAPWPGEQSVRLQGAAQAHRPLPSEPWLSYWLGVGELSWAGGSSAAQRVRAPAYESAPPPAAPAITSMPKESVLTMLRDQLIPQARGCLRVDRKGRGDYAVALTFHALFAEREAYDVRIEGSIPEALRRCLLDVVAKLRIPAFAGRIRVSYPIHTEREPEAPVIELMPEAREQVDRVIGAK